jgi:hypothetical protein
MLLYLLKKSTANESRLLSADNRAHNCQNDEFWNNQKEEEHFFEDVNSMY